VAIIVVVGISAVIAVSIAAVTLQSVRCLWEGRDGWTVEHPPSSVSEAEFRRVVADQTTCVDLTVRRVNTDAVADGFVVRPIGGRSWVSRTGSLEVLVASAPGEDVIECGEPIRPVSAGMATQVLACGGSPPPS
jgi:hypothetical protein